MEWFEWVNQPEAWTALLVLTVLEIVLGIDNIIFISILADRLPKEQRPSARFFGLALALVSRVLLLFSIAWLMKLTNVLFTVPIPDFLANLLEPGGGGHGHAPGGEPVVEPGVAEVKEHLDAGRLPFTGKGLILFLGGLFLIWKATKEIHHKMEEKSEQEMEKIHAADVKKGKIKQTSYASVLVTIAFMDIIFSLDSVITAVGMAKLLPVMVIAVLIAVGFMMLTAGPVSNFVNEHPTVKILALSFLILVGTALVAEGLYFHIPKGYIYFAMAFSVVVEMINIRLRKKPALPGTAS